MKKSSTEYMNTGLGTFMALLLWCSLCVPASSAESGQATFKSPQEAVKSLIAAVTSGQTHAMLAVLGADAKDLVSTGDPVADKLGRDKFLHAVNDMTRLVQRSDGSVVLNVGTNQWPFPIPLVKQGEVWHFETSAGKEEILNRRIGGNEMQAIRVCKAYVDAQREYASEARQDDLIVEYAQKFKSDHGQRNGLYWDVEPGAELSPLGPQVAEARAEGYVGTASKGHGFHGYHFKILTRQGAHAAGGEFDYVINGHMVAGFAEIAYPVEYGITGVMTFIVNRNGIIYEKDLGDKTEEIATSMTSYDPDDSWKRVK